MLHKQNQLQQLCKLNLHSSNPQQLHQLLNRLQQHLATRVTLDHGEKRGRIEIEYYGKDDLQRILDLIGLGSE